MPKEKKEITKEVIEYVITPATIEAMKKQYSGMKITDAASDKAVRAARTFMVSQRTSVEKWRIEQNEEANDWRRRINQKAKEITALLLPIEEPLQIEVKRVDDEKAKEKAQKAAQEQARKDGIQEKIHEIRMPTGGINLMDLKGLKEVSDELEKIEITEKEYMESTDEAEKALDGSYDAVQSAIAARIKLDKEAEEREAEAERLKEVGRKQAVDQAKIDEANKKIKVAQKKIDDDKKAEEDRKKQEALEKAATEKAEAAAAQKVKDDAAKKIEEEKAEEAEKERKEASRPDREKLRAFADYLQEDLKYPELHSKKSKGILKSARTQIYDIGNEILETLEEL